MDTVTYESKLLWNVLNTCVETTFPPFIKMSSHGLFMLFSVLFVNRFPINIIYPFLRIVNFILVLRCSSSYYAGYQMIWDTNGAKNKNCMDGITWNRDSSKIKNLIRWVCSWWLENLFCYIVTASCRLDILSMTLLVNTRYYKKITTPSLHKVSLGLVRKWSKKRLHLMALYYWLHIEIRERGHWLLPC